MFKDIIDYVRRVFSGFSFLTLPPGIPYYRIPRDGTRRQAAHGRGPIPTASGFDTGAGFHHIAKEVKG